MKRYFILIFTTIMSLGISSYTTIENSSGLSIDPPSLVFKDYSITIYNQINDSDLNFDAFKTALKGYLRLQQDHKVENSKYLSIIDMSLSANENRFFLIDMESKKLILKNKVAHGRNSGSEFATTFSNKVGSYKSSLGFFKTAETYSGKHGFSMRLDGLEFSNSNARNRAIVMHSADYVNDNFIFKNGRLGRSLGCPALPEKGFSETIKRIKGGSILYIYYPDESYFERSDLAKSKFERIFENYNNVSLTN